MKHTKKILGTMLLTAAAVAVTSCVDDSKLLFAFEKPASIAGMEYLNEYDALKTYVNSSANPNFKLGIALTADDYIAGGLVTRLANSNFQEMTAGNAMKYASCVADDGTMNFGTVEKFVAAAKAGGLTIYGHTLAWHAQQNNKYLNSLIKDKELPPSQGVGNCLHIKTSEAKANPWDWQILYDLASPLLAGKTYSFSMRTKASAATTFPLWIETPNAGNTNYGLPQISVGTTWSVISFEFTSSSDCSRLLFSFGKFGGDLYFDDIVLVEKGDSHNMFSNGTFEEGDLPSNWSKPGWHSYTYGIEPSPGDAAAEVEQEKKVRTYQDGPFPFYAMGCEPPVVDGYIHFVPTGSWSQFFILPSSENTLEEGNYVLYLDIKSSKDASGVQLTMQNGWGGTDQQITVTVPIKEGNHIVKLNLPNVAGGNYDVIFKPQTTDAILDIKSVKIYKVVKLNSIPLTPAEKKDTLTWAMNNWINGMMKATGGYVTAWDVVNEAIAGGGDDGEGFYPLQSATNVSADDAKNNFYWQDYLGSEDYVRIAVAAARKYYAENGGTNPLRLFVNDYNLESDWDDNKKVKSLVHWIEKWEADGVTKIDGIGTQMHVSCHANSETQKGKEDHVVKMFEILAESGKLVKITELDMGYVDEEGNSVKTADMTEAQHKAMSEYYKFIVKKYFEIIPAAQQYGITQWCITDSPTGSGWRGGEPVGLWDANYNRKHTYAGFADGLAGR
ncbi:endo-1,4-beta-xylanase [Bacteroides graminisolvens]|uniref:endo-1,4-beta-xylanase n=1 Tax=Bacteroides graminisolvens TaxID=477666 RepID=UPI0029C643B0|nr:endo-1,4-beta-xylanase [Bacteroides graminisolvens]